MEIFSSQAQIWKFSVHKPPFSEASISSQASHFRNPGRTPLPEKKLSAPQGLNMYWEGELHQRTVHGFLLKVVTSN